MEKKYTAGEVLDNIKVGQIAKAWFKDSDSLGYRFTKTTDKYEPIQLVDYFGEISTGLHFNQPFFEYYYFTLVPHYKEVGIEEAVEAIREGLKVNHVAKDGEETNVPSFGYNLRSTGLDGLGLTTLFNATYRIYE